MPRFRGDHHITLFPVCTIALMRHWYLGTTNRIITRQLSLRRMWAKRPLFPRVVSTQVLVPIPIFLLQNRPWRLLSRFDLSIASPPVAVLEIAHRRALRPSQI